MYNSNEALKALSDALANIVEVKVDSVTDDKVSLYGVRGKITFGIFFDTQKQLFGFNLLTGGVKTFKTIEQFVAMFDTYAYINVVFIPKAKVVADTFEKDLSLNSVYKTFVGNKNIGFSAIFQVLGADTQLIVTECKEDYLFKAEYVHPMTDREKKVIAVRYYTLLVEDDGKMECFRRLEVAEILDTLMKKSWEDTDKFLDFKVLNGGIFEVTMKDFSYRMEVESATDNDVVFKLIAVNGEAVEPYRMRPEDWQDLSRISDLTISLYESMIKPTEEPTEESVEVVEEQVQEAPEEEPVEESADVTFEEPVEESVEEDTIEEGVKDLSEEPTEEGADEALESAEEVVEEEPVEEATEEVETTEEIGLAEVEEQAEDTVSEEAFKEEEMTDLRLCLAYKGEECQGVLASLNGELILFDLDLVNNSSLYIDRITESEEMETSSGVEMYPSERKFKKFAKKGTAEELNSVISKLFGF